MTGVEIITASFWVAFLGVFSARSIADQIKIWRLKKVTAFHTRIMGELLESMRLLSRNPVVSEEGNVVKVEFRSKT